MDYFARGKKQGEEEGKTEREAERQSMFFFSLELHGDLR